MPQQPKRIISESIVMISTAFSLVAALAWNEAIKQFIGEFLPKGQGILSLFIYATLVTVIAVIITSHLSKIKDRIGEGESKDA